MAAVYVIGGVLVGSGSTALTLAQDGRWHIAIMFGFAAIIAAAIFDKLGL